MDEPARRDAISIPWFGARKAAYRLASELERMRAEFESTRDQLERLTSLSHQMVAELKETRAERDMARESLDALGGLSVLELQIRQRDLENKIRAQSASLERERADAKLALEEANLQLKKAREGIIETDDLRLLQEVGIYQYRHPLSDIVSYERALETVKAKIKEMVKKDGGAILSATSWTVNGSASEGRTMVREFSKLMLRAFNAEADVLVRGLKPYKLDSALDRLKKSSEVIERLGKTMNIRVSPAYYELRRYELELTGDYLQKEAEAKEVEREERERMREERKAQAEMERERVRLEKERQHYVNALSALVAKGDQAAADRLREQLAEVEAAIEQVDYRAANIRAGYVYVISNIGSFGEKMVKIGMTRRLDPLERVRELSDASVPFNFDIHALFFSKDAVGLEAKLHAHFAATRVNLINQRREFFRVSALEVKAALSQVSVELLEFQETPEAVEYRQSLHVRQPERRA